MALHPIANIEDIRNELDEAGLGLCFFTTYPDYAVPYGLKSQEPPENYADAIETAISLREFLAQQQTALGQSRALRFSTQRIYPDQRIWSEIRLEGDVDNDSGAYPYMHAFEELREKPTFIKRIDAVGDELRITTNSTPLSADEIAETLEERLARHEKTLKLIENKQTPPPASVFYNEPVSREEALKVLDTYGETLDVMLAAGCKALPKELAPILGVSRKGKLVFHTDDPQMNNDLNQRYQPLRNGGLSADDSQTLLDAAHCANQITLHFSYDRILTLMDEGAPLPDDLQPLLTLNPDKLNDDERDLLDFVKELEDIAAIERAKPTGINLVNIEDLQMPSPKGAAR